MKRHRWKKQYLPGRGKHPEIMRTGEICERCGCEREVIGEVGVQSIRSYITVTGIRFTGKAPSCKGEKS